MARFKDEGLGFDLRREPAVLSAAKGLVPANIEQVLLGTEVGGKQVTLSRATRERGVLVQGSSGYGKTRLLVALCLADILAGRTGILLDPVGTTGKLLMEYLGAITCALESCRRAASSPPIAEHYRELLRLLHGRVNILDLSDPNQTHRINLCASLPGLSASETVEAVILPILKKELGDMGEARRLLMVLRSALAPVVEAGGCLADVLDLLSVAIEVNSISALMKELDRRHHRLGKRPGIIHRYFREMYMMLPRGDRLGHTQSAWHGLGTILGHPTCARLFGSTKTTFNIQEIVQRGGYMIVVVPQREGAAAPVVSSAVLGLTNQACLQRDLRAVQTGKAPEVFLTVDEFHLALGRDRSIHDLVATCRNIGLRLCVAFQHERQGDLGENPNLVANWRANTATHIYFRCALDSARSYIAEHVHRPQGRRVKRRYQQRTTTTTRTRSLTISRQVSLAVALAQSRGQTTTLTASEGQTVSVTRSEGTTVVETEGLTIAEGRTFQSAWGESFSFTKSSGETTVNGRSLGSTETSSQTEVENISMGQSRTYARAYPGHMSVGIEMEPSGMPQMRRSFSTAASSTRSNSLAKQLSSSVSEVISEAKAASNSESTSTGTSLSKGRAYSSQRARTRTLASGLSQVKALAQGLSASVGRSEAETQSSSLTRSQNYSRGVAEQRALAQGQSVREVEELYTLDEEVRLLAYEIASLPRQHAVMVSDQASGSRVMRKMKVVDVPDVETKIAGLDGLALLRARCCGPERSPAPPRRSLLERAGVRPSGRGNRRVGT